MSFLRHLARTMLASVFVVEGLDAVRDPYRKAEGAGAVLQGAARRVGPVPDEDAALLVRATGAVQLGAGLALITDTATRPAALLLAATALPDTVGEEPFWEADGEERRARMRRFLTRLGLLGGLVVVALDTEGRPGMAWKTAWAVRRAGELADHKREIVELKAELARERAHAAAAEARGRVQGTTAQVRRDARVAATAGRAARRVLTGARRGAGRAVKAATPG